jgi:predicted transposase YbfD/YdcC
MAKDAAEIITAESILAEFSSLDDPRSQVNRKHSLGDIIVISIMAVIAGADGPKAIGIWAMSNKDWLSERLDLIGGIPSHDTIGRVLLSLNPSLFQQCFERWINSISGDTSASGASIIAVAGKALRRSHNRKSSLGPLFLVSAWAVERGLSLGQLATDEKSNEITAIPQLLDQIAVEGSVVTIDAAGCQKAIAEPITSAKGDYVFALKGNQGNLFEEVSEYVIEHMDNDFADVPVKRHSEKSKSHGRVDTMIYYQMPIPSSFKSTKGWAGIRTIGVVVRNSKVGDQESHQVRFYISSLAENVKLFAQCVRGHWAIENTLHWCLDVTFREDESRVRDRTLANNLAWLKRFAISLLKQVDDKDSITMRRRKAGWNPTYLAKALGIPA